MPEKRRLTFDRASLFGTMTAALSAVVVMASVTTASAGVTVLVDVSAETMRVSDDASGTQFNWKVSTAKPGYRTPIGTFHPAFLEKMHYSTLYENSPMPHSIFFHGNFAIHGTDHLKRLGKPASHGCIRLAPQNAAVLFDIVSGAGMRNVVIRITP